MEKLHSTVPVTVQQARAVAIKTAKTGVLRSVRLMRVGTHANTTVKFRFYNHPQAPPASGIAASPNDPLAAIAAAANNMFAITPEYTVAGNVVESINLDLNYPFTNRRGGALGQTDEIYLGFDAAVAQDWLVSLDVTEGAL